MMEPNLPKKNKAQAMVVVAIYISVVSLLGVYMMVFASQLNNQVVREYNHLRGVYAGEAGLIVSISRMFTNTANGAVALTFSPITVNVTSTAVGVGFQLRSVVSNWIQTTGTGAGTKIAINSSFPLAFGEYSELTSREIIDYDDPNRTVAASNFKADPSGTTRLTTLLLYSQTFNNGEGTAGNIKIAGSIISPTGAYFINLNATAGNNAMYVHSVRILERIEMGAPSPPPTNGALPIGGKHVYDIAECMSAVSCEGGDVAVINPAADTLLVKSATAWSDQIAGVISEDPKVNMGPGEGKMPLALAGIVSCKVSAENGPIKRGDLLVSSSIPGHAMAAKPQQVKPGMLVGKALQPLDKGTGKIFILVIKQ